MSSRPWLLLLCALLLIACRRDEHRDAATPAPASGSPMGQLPAPADSPTPAPRRGAVLLGDDFNGIKALFLPDGRAGHDFTGLYSGEYVIYTPDPNRQGYLVASIPGTFDNAVLSVDARVARLTYGRAVALGCRANEDGHYALYVYPDIRIAAVYAVEGDKEVPLWSSTSDAIQPADSVNHIDLACIGDSIEVTINDTPLASIRDSRWSTGGLFIGAGGRFAVPFEVHFDNLRVYDYVMPGRRARTPVPMPLQVVPLTSLLAHRRVYLAVTAPVDCHAGPDADTPVVTQWPAVAIKAVDAWINWVDGVWYYHADDGCFVGERSLAFKAFSRPADAQAYLDRVVGTPG